MHRFCVIQASLNPLGASHKKPSLLPSPIFSARLMGGGGQQNRNQSLRPAAADASSSSSSSSSATSSTRPRRKFQKRLPSRHHLPQHQHQLPSYLTVTMGNFLTSPMTEKDTRVDARADGSLAFGISAMQGWRTSMEDSHVAQLAPEGFPPGTAIFAVCDGHGGRLAAAVSEDLFTTVILDVFDERKYYKPTAPTPEQIGDAMREAFMTLDAEIRSYPEVQNGSDQSGCTAIVAFVTPTHIIVANSGDSRSVLAKNAGMIPMSFDHKPMNDGERRRIENAGGMVRGNRVNGDLAVSRALGDFTYKMRSDLPAEQQQVSAEPEIEIQEINGTEEFLVLACDGIWDVMTNEGICDFVRGLMANGEKNLGLIAEEILDHCLQEGSRDNMSAIVVKFPGAKFGSGEGVEAIRKERKRKQEEAEARGETLENDNFGA